jgi:2-phosphosulfolactate phosphatase
MSSRVEVHLLAQWLTPQQLRGGVAVVIDVLRATTTIVHALAAGCTAVLPEREVEAARHLARRCQPPALLGGERDGLAPEGFDLGNSPQEYTPQRCRGRQLVLTTTNGTQAIHAAASADCVLLAAFVNFSAVCERLLPETRPIHLVCAGTRGEVALEDTLLAGALVEALVQGRSCPPRKRPVRAGHGNDAVELNDAARLAWDCFEHHGKTLEESLRLSQGGRNLLRLGLERDIAAAAQIDRFHLVPQLASDPLRIEIGAVGISRPRWRVVS